MCDLTDTLEWFVICFQNLCGMVVVLCKQVDGTCLSHVENMMIRRPLISLIVTR